MPRAALSAQVCRTPPPQCTRCYVSRTPFDEVFKLGMDNVLSLADLTASPASDVVASTWQPAGDPTAAVGASVVLGLGLLAAYAAYSVQDEVSSGARASEDVETVHVTENPMNCAWPRCVPVLVAISFVIFFWLL
jgi:hypothetical protein